MFPQNNSGWIELICGPMFSGKTEELIRRLRRAQIAKQRVAIFKPKIDNRFGNNHIVSHSSLKLESFLVETPKDILEHSYDAHVIGIDEAQFFDETLIPVCRKMANGGKRVLVAGLDKDYTGNAFGSMPLLLTEAEEVSKLLSICMKCGAPANFTQRLSMDKEQVVVGEADKYEARCRRCYEAVH
jgi:thymidine kinase